MSDVIFLIQEGKIAELNDQPYDSEALLQRLLADHPSLIAGSQIDSRLPRRWLLVSREMAVPSDENGVRRWALDHLFLDQDGIPTLVEVKRSTDSRIRREVVGQMLDYAANAVLYWPVEEIRARFNARCEMAGLDPEEQLAAVLREEEANEFWSKVKTNLQAGKIRLIFVADIVPPELRRIVEFMNEQMDPAEVLALEIRQYVGEGIQTLVPRVIGQTAEAQQRKAVTTQERRNWDEASFFAAIEERKGAVAAGVARRVYDWATLKGRIWFGSGKHDGSFGLTIDSVQGKSQLLAVYTTGQLEIQFQWMRTGPVFGDESKRLELLARLNAVEGVSLPSDSIGRRPSVRLETLRPAQRLEHFCQALDWAVEQVKVADEARISK